MLIHDKMFQSFLLLVKTLRNWITFNNAFCLFQFSEYDKAVEGIGGKGFRLDRTNEDQIESVLQEAIKLSRDGQSVLVNVLIGKTNFRDGSISV